MSDPSRRLRRCISRAECAPLGSLFASVASQGVRRAPAAQSFSANPAQMTYFLDSNGMPN
jgi:hypothetical protein